MIKDFNSYITPEKTLREALFALRKSSLKTLIVLNKHDQYLGTITDGDIRRTLLEGSSIDDLISTKVGPDV